MITITREQTDNMQTTINLLKSEITGMKEIISKKSIQEKRTNMLIQTIPTEDTPPFSDFTDEDINEILELIDEEEKANFLKLKSILISKLLPIREEAVKLEKENKELKQENKELKQNEMEIKHTFYNCTFTDSNINL